MTSSKKFFKSKVFTPANISAIIVPCLWLFLFTPYGMDTTDFGYFYGYAWRILEGQIPYRDFTYIKPAFPLYWHAFWLWLTPEKYAILAGKAGFLLSILTSSWLCALYLARQFRFAEMKLPVSLLATAGFIFGVHSFPHMPWHTADGILFSTLAIWLSSFLPLAGGLAAACAVACKQSFLPVPFVIIIMLLLSPPRRGALLFIAGLLAGLICFYLWLAGTNSLENFLRMTTGQLDWHEAIEAGILIYIRQNWLLPLLALLPWAIGKTRNKSLPLALQPCFSYMLILSFYYIWQVDSLKKWLGFGFSWPTLFLCLGGIVILLPRKFLLPVYKYSNYANAEWKAAFALGTCLVVSWCAAISGGYKTPAMLAVPGLFAFFLVQRWMGGKVPQLAWLSLFCGMAMFASGYQYPYVFPERPLARWEQIHDAGQIYPTATGVMVDADMLARLAELKALRQKYGPHYKTMPGFTLAYFLNHDQPLYGSDWLIDWEINGDTDNFYRDLVEKDLLVFMERDQLDTTQADAYARAGYTVPQMVRRNWRIIDETPHFVVFQAPRE